MNDDRETLCNGDFSIQASDEDTRLTAIAPIISESSQVVQSGDYREWGESKWNSLIERIEPWGRRDLQRELAELKKHVIKERILNETPIFDDDDESRGVKAVHTLELHYSKKLDYVIVRGTMTQQYRDKLEELGLQWNPRDREWRTKYSWETFKQVREFVKEHDRAHDPREIRYEKCPYCGRWKPEEKQCPCRTMP